METAGIIAAVIAALLVGGYAAVAWLRHGRDPRLTDDPSILMPAPPPEMTAATAVVIRGQPTSLAFMAALLDLASRDEIRFRDEGGDGRRDRVGIEIRGTDTGDPSVALNRRRPIGDGEAWLLTQLKAALLLPAATSAFAGLDSGHSGTLSAEGIDAMSEAMQAYLQFAAFAGTDTGSAEVRALREHGLFSGGMPDVDALVRGAEVRSGHPLSPVARASLERVRGVLDLIGDPAEIARDPEAAAGRIEARIGKRPSPEQMTQLSKWAAATAAKRAQTADPDPRYIPAATALQLRAPALFGTYIEQYAVRHGWLAGVPLFRRLRWRVTGIVEVAVAAIVLMLGSRGGGDVLTGAGIGVALGGIATWLIAPAMPSTTREGAVMRAQLEAYRRTLEATFRAAPSLEAAVAGSPLRWLETPDQAVVWGIALGLRRQIEGLLARTAADANAGGAAGTGYLPAWYARSPGTTSGGAHAHDAVAMFAGIEAIGSAAAAAGVRRPRASVAP